MAMILMFSNQYLDPTVKFRLFKN